LIYHPNIDYAHAGSHCVFILDLHAVFSMQKHALESGVTTVNGKTAPPDFVLKNGDRIESVHLL
jgi:hypothetical protein